MRHYSEDEVRQTLRKRIEGQKQCRVAEEIGVGSNFLSMVLRGAPVTGKILTWLGFSRGPKVYVRR